MRIMTYAVRQALAANSPDPEPDQGSSSSGSTQASEVGQHLIPCAGSPTKTRQRPAQAEADSHRDKRIRTINSRTSASGGVKLQYCGRESLQGEMAKYWYQRNRLFWRFDEGIKLDHQSWYSVTPEGIARQIAERCRTKVIVDAFCGAGGNAIQFASTSDRVIAIDIDPNKIALAEHNATVYGVEDKIEFICADFIEWIQNQEKGSVDVIFLSPPWGGVDYLSFNSPNKSHNQSKPSEPTGFYPLTELQPIPGKELFSITSKVTPNIAFYLPRNLDVDQVADLVDQDVKIEVEEAWMTSKCKAVTVYFGDLVAKTVT